MGDHDERPEFWRGRPLLEKAYSLAAEAHRDQTRKDGVSPYVGHPLAVARRLAEAELDEATVAAAILHDVVEDSELGVGDVVERFGVEIGELVSSLTDDRTIDDYETRKREHRERVAEAGPRAAAIYAADKLINVGDLRRLYAEVGEAAGARFNAPIDVRVGLWWEDLVMLDRVTPGLAVVDELRTELVALEHERAGSSRAAIT